MYSKTSTVNVHEHLVARSRYVRRERKVTTVTVSESECESESSAIHPPLTGERVILVNEGRVESKHDKERKFETTHSQREERIQRTESAECPSMTTTITESMTPHS